MYLNRRGFLVAAFVHVLLNPFMHLCITELKQKYLKIIHKVGGVQGRSSDSVTLL